MEIKLTVYGVQPDKSSKIPQEEYSLMNLPLGICLALILVFVAQIYLSADQSHLDLRSTRITMADL
jgi:hypothetical protein